jgi:hypothetical protein
MVLKMRKPHRPLARVPGGVLDTRVGRAVGAYENRLVKAYAQQVCGVAGSSSRC